MWIPLTSSQIRHLLGEFGRGSTQTATEIEDLASRYEIPDRSVFHFSARRRLVDSLAISVVTQSAFRFTASTNQPSDSVHIGFVLNGSRRVGWPGQEPDTFTQQGAYALPRLDAANLESLETSRWLDIEIPQSRLDDRDVARRISGIRISGSAALTTPIRGFAMIVADEGWRPSLVAEKVVGRAMEDLIVGMFLEADGYAMDGQDLRAGLRARAISRVALRHRDSSLNPRVVAAEIGASLRHLQRAFEGSGMSVAQHILKHRVESASLLLSTPAHPGPTISEVAVRSGFASTFELRSAFKARYGMLPSEYRAPALMDSAPERA